MTMRGPRAVAVWILLIEFALVFAYWRYNRY
jgi:hypothetical protein